VSAQPRPGPAALAYPEARIRELKAAVESLRADREYLLWRLEETERHWGRVLHDVVESPSWRLTRPLRSAARLLRRRSA
jgi:hypothetical protein